MSDTPTPHWLTAALAETVHLQPSLKLQAPTEVGPGDVCVVHPFTRSNSIGRLFVVRQSAGDWCEGFIAGAETELATEVDAILPSDSTDLAYPIAVHSRFHGPVWITQVARRVGSVQLDDLDDIERLSWTDYPDVDVVIGLPLQPSPIDPRYPALQALSNELDSLTDHCRRRRHELSQPLLDPALADIDVLRQLLTEPGWEAALADAASSPEFRERLLLSIPDLSNDERRTVMPFIERAAAMTSVESPSAEGSHSIADHRDSDALGKAVARRSTPSVTVLSHHRCWVGPVRHSVRIQFNATEECLIMTVPIDNHPILEAA